MTNEPSFSGNSLVGLRRSFVVQTQGPEAQSPDSCPNGAESDGVAPPPAPMGLLSDAAPQLTTSSLPPPAILGNAHGTDLDAADNGLVSKPIVSKIQRVPRFSGNLLTALIVIGVTGCQTTSGPWNRPESALATVTVPEPLTVAPAAPLPFPPAETNDPPVAIVVPAWPREWVNAWVPLES